MLDKNLESFLQKILRHRSHCCLTVVLNIQSFPSKMLRLKNLKKVV